MKKQDLKNRLKGLFHRPEKPKNGMEIPNEWLQEPSVKHQMDTGKFTIIKTGTRRKLRIPGLRTAKRLIATALMIFFFVLSQITWLSAPATQWFAILFLLNSFILADYLWKTKKKKKV